LPRAKKGLKKQLRHTEQTRYGEANNEKLHVYVF